MCVCVYIYCIKYIIFREKNCGNFTNIGIVEFFRFYLFLLKYLNNMINIKF